MMHKPPRYTHGFVDRHGKARWYFRRRGFKQVPLRGLPWSPEFMADYEAAMHGQTAPKIEIGASHIAAGSVNALVTAYLDCSV
jgi:hypothetical protein